MNISEWINLRSVSKGPYESKVEHVMGFRQDEGNDVVLVEGLGPKPDAGIAHHGTRKELRVLSNQLSSF